MTGPEHYTTAEVLLSGSVRALKEAIDAANQGRLDDDAMRDIAVVNAATLAAAQVHATLALTAATAMYPIGITLDGETARAWREAIL